MTNSVVIGQLRIRLHIHERNAASLQARCSRLFHARLRQQLSTVLSENVPADGASRSSGRLTLNVGDISLSRFEAELCERVIQQLKKQLRHLPSGRQSDTGRNISDNKNASHARNPEIATALPAAGAEPDLFRRMLHYLDTGITADPRAWTGQHQRNAWLTEALVHAPDTISDLPSRAALALRLLSPRARKRLLQTWSGEALSRLAAWLIAPLRLPEPGVQDAVWLLPLAAIIALQRQPVTAYAAGQRILQAWQVATDRAGTALPDGIRLQQQIPARADSAADIWFRTLLDAPLPVPAHQALLTWLREPDNSGKLMTGLARLSVAVRRRLYALPGMALSDITRPRLQLPSGVNPPGVTLFPERTGHAVPHPEPDITEEHRSLAAAQADKAPDPLIVAGAGLALLWPLLPQLFSNAGLLEEGIFTDDQARWQAMACLDWLAWGDEALAEWRTPVARLLCGIALNEPFLSFPPPQALQATLDGWLERAFSAVSPLNRCSVNDLRFLFLQRYGLLSTEERVTLVTESNAADILLHNLPWPLTSIMLPWLSAPISVGWTL